MTTSLKSLKASFAAGEMSKAEFIRTAATLHRRLHDYVTDLSGTDVGRITIDDDGVCFQMRSEDVRLYAPAGEARVAPLEILNFDRYEPAETRVIDMLAEGARTILDIGANIGWYAVRFARRRPEVMVHAFEPMPLTYGYLLRNVAANGVGDRVRGYNYALSETNGAARFFAAPGNGTNASLANVAAAADAQEITVATLTLDDWSKAHGVAPDFVKCDVEGAEYLVFRGGRATLTRHRPAVFSELLRKWAKPFGYHPNDVITFMAELGYLTFAVGDAGVYRITEVTEETVETNYAFLHGEAHADLIEAIESGR